MFRGAFGVLHIGGALLHVWKVGWCLKAWMFGALEVCKCTFEVVIVDLNVSIV